MSNNEEILLEGVTLIWPNFAGEERKFNKAGDRNFSVDLDDKMAGMLSKAGYKVKQSNDREIDGEVVPGRLHLPVAINFKFKPPQITMIGGTTKRRTMLDEEACGILDDMEMENVDLVIRPFDYDFNGNKGRKTMLKKMFVTVVEDYLDMKYADVE